MISYPCRPRHPRTQFGDQSPHRVANIDPGVEPGDDDEGPVCRPIGSILSVALLTLALALIAPIASKAALLSAQDLTTSCSGDLRARTICDGYLMAVTDAILLRESRGRTGGRVCLPEAVTLDQVRDAVLNIAQRPRAAHAPSGVMLVMMAMRVTWPCDEAPGQRNGTPTQQ
jgi:Rap1a immunity proteins